MYSILNFITTALSILSIATLGEAASGVTTWNDYTTQSGVACSGEKRHIQGPNEESTHYLKGTSQQIAKGVTYMHQR